MHFPSFFPTLFAPGISKPCPVSVSPGPALRLGAAGAERELGAAEAAAAAAAFPRSYGGQPRLLLAPGQPQPPARRELSPGCPARHPAVRVARTHGAPAGLALRLQTSAAAPRPLLQPGSPRRGAPGARGHQPPPAAFPHCAPDSVQAPLPAPLVHRGVARRLRRLSAEPHQTQPVPLHVRTWLTQEFGSRRNMVFITY